eukprot:CAMPEP_0180529330 /NCGR_PEP_ID=MMETSP1036_2-20121128/61305_1 /TAXON_ID=632150 /ORGANISM="Azadinium spinosum, Strain 3D9" /LENGTH=36 /DNA_ID= /DNA_START= /DNA_END= /DNA_ORIENTATION=
MASAMPASKARGKSRRFLRLSQDSARKARSCCRLTR